MIVLCNLNTYIGGGEILLLRYAAYLKSNSIDFKIICCDSGYIYDESEKYNYPCIKWPTKYTSLIYQNKETVNLVSNLIKNDINVLIKAKVFCFCLRDVYNLLTISKAFPDTLQSITTGIYHPDDYKYLSSLSFNSRRIIDNNKDLFRLLDDQKSIIFMNQFGSIESLGRACSDISRIIPIPIKLQGIDLKFNTNVKQNINITCISRFAAFKMPAVLHFIKSAANNPKLNYTLIGHGTWLPLVKLSIAVNRVRNIKLFTDVSPDELETYIEKTDIGFAQGTSVLEFVSRGVPTIVAPYSSLVKLLFRKKYYTHSFFGFDSHLGDEQYDKMKCYHTIDKLIEAYPESIIENKNSIKATLDTFDEQKVFANLTDVIINAKAAPKQLIKFIPKAPLFKLLIKKILGNKI